MTRDPRLATNRTKPMSIRTDRVASLIQREVADILQKDFREASHSLVTITDTRITNDLSIATLTISVLGGTEEARKAAFLRLERQSDEIRHSLAGRIRHDLRRVPELRLVFDEGSQRAARMDELLEQIREGGASRRS